MEEATELHSEPQHVQVAGYIRHSLFDIATHHIIPERAIELATSRPTCQALASVPLLYSLLLYHCH